MKEFPGLERVIQCSMLSHHWPGVVRKKGTRLPIHQLLFQYFLQHHGRKMDDIQVLWIDFSVISLLLSYKYGRIIVSQRSNVLIIQNLGWVWGANVLCNTWCCRCVPSVSIGPSCTGALLYIKIIHASSRIPSTLASMQHEFRMRGGQL